MVTNHDLKRKVFKNNFDNATAKVTACLSTLDFNPDFQFRKSILFFRIIFA